MARDTQLVALFVGLHVVGIGVIVALLLMFLRAETTRGWAPPDEDEGGGGGGSDRLPPRAPGGPGDDGLPLPPTPAPPASACATKPGAVRLSAGIPPRARSAATRAGRLFRTH